MPIIQNKNLLYVHIAKNGGSTLGKLLNYKINIDRTPTTKKTYQLTSCQNSHRSPHYYEEHMIPHDIRFHYQQKIQYYNQLIKFVTIRNPIDRIISLYTFIMSTKMQARYKKYTSNDFFKMTFYQFLLTIKKIFLNFKPSSEPYDFESKNQKHSIELILYQLARPQMFYFIYFPERIKNRYQFIKKLFQETDTKVLELSAVKYDFIIYFEYFNETLQQLFKQKNVPRENQSKNRTKNFLSSQSNKEECLQLIEEIYKEDFLFLGYSFESKYNEHLNYDSKSLIWFETFLSLYSNTHLFIGKGDE